MTTELDREGALEAGQPTVSERRTRTRERLLDAAFDVFTNLGVSGASIEAICEAAGFTRGAFYSNFESKEELFLALCERELRTRVANLEEVAGTLGGSVVRGRRVDPEVVRTVLSAVMSDARGERRWHLMTAEFELLALRDADVAARYTEQQRKLLDELAEVLVRVLASARLRFVVAPRDAATLLVDAYEAAARDAFLADPDDAAAAEHTRTSTALGTLVDLLITDD